MTLVVYLTGVVRGSAILSQIHAEPLPASALSPQVIASGLTLCACGSASLLPASPFCLSQVRGGMQRSEARSSASSALGLEVASAYAAPVGKPRTAWNPWKILKCMPPGFLYVGFPAVLCHDSSMSEHVLGLYEGVDLDSDQHGLLTRLCQRLRVKQCTEHTEHRLQA